VSSARAAFRKGAWANFAPAKRKKILLRFADAILKHTEELALLETLDMGKPISDSLKIDIPGAARCLSVMAEAIDQVYDQVAATERGRSRSSRASPWGSSGRSCRGITRCSWRPGNRPPFSRRAILWC